MSDFESELDKLRAENRFWRDRYFDVRKVMFVLIGIILLMAAVGLPIGVLVIDKFDTLEGNQNRGRSERLDFQCLMEQEHDLPRHSC